MYINSTYSFDNMHKSLFNSYIFKALFLWISFCVRENHPILCHPIIRICRINRRSFWFGTSHRLQRYELNFGFYVFVSNQNKCMYLYIRRYSDNCIFISYMVWQNMTQYPYDRFIIHYYSFLMKCLYKPWSK